jgi:hypothetical protein
MRNIYIVPSNTPIDDSVVATATAAGCTEIAQGIPPALDGIVLPNQLPTVWREPDSTYPPSLVPPPNVNGFLLAIFEALGFDTANRLAASYPIFNIALAAGNWSLAKQVLDAALAAGALTQTQHDNIIQLGIQFNIPFVSTLLSGQVTTVSGQINVTSGP